MTAKKNKPTTNAILAAIRDAGKSLNVGELANELLKAFGGAAEFASRFRAEYDDAKEGSIAKTKMLECVTRIVSTASARHKDALDDLSQFSDADLEKLLKQLMGGEDSADAKKKGKA